MQNRIYIKDLKDHLDTHSTGSGQEEVTIAGWVDVRRDQGKMVFFDMRDMTGKVQCVALPSRTEIIGKGKEIRPEWVLKITGMVNKRPEKNIKTGVLNGDVELEATSIEILSKAEIPFELNESLNLDTHLDNLPYTLRSERAKDIF